MREYPGDRVDLRSDTVTQPTPAMREAMSQATVGDDVLGDDPTVIELQDRMAAMLGKESALFVPSGTMCNATAIRAQTEPGDEIITEAHSHIYIYEGGGFAALSGVSVALVPGMMGIMDPADVARAVRKGDGSLGHFPNGSMICVENTSNRGGGTCYPLETMDAIAAVASDNVRDPFYAYGDLDVFEVFSQAVRIAQLDYPVGDWPSAVTRTPADTMGLPNVGRLKRGSPADIVIFNARNYSELFPRPQTDRLVIRNGGAIDTTPPDYRELDGLILS